MNGAWNGGRSVLDPVVPSVRFRMSEATAPLGQALGAAVGILVDAGLLRTAGPSEHADLLHTVGDVRRAPADGAASRRVHTLDRVVLRPGGGLAPSLRWLHGQRSHASGCAAVLTHGRTAGRVVVDSALARGERVFCLPVLPAPAATSPGVGSRRATAARIDARGRLGVPPGVHLVVGTSSVAGAAVGDWATALWRLGRRDVRVVDIPDDAWSSGGGDDSPWQLALQAADLFVAARRELTAASAAVSCIGLGIPVITVTTDSAAELVTPGWDGRVVAPKVDCIVDAVVSALDRAWLPRATAVTSVPAQRSRELARYLLDIYEQALASPAPSGRSMR